MMTATIWMVITIPSASPMHRASLRSDRMLPRMDGPFCSATRMAHYMQNPRPTPASPRTTTCRNVWSNGRPKGATGGGDSSCNRGCALVLPPPCNHRHTTQQTPGPFLSLGGPVGAEHSNPICQVSAFRPRSGVKASSEEFTTDDASDGPRTPGGRRVRIRLASQP